MKKSFASAAEYGFKNYAVRGAAKVAPFGAKNNWLKRSALVFAILALSFSSFGHSFTIRGVDAASVAPTLLGGNDKVKLCHHNNGASEYSAVQAQADAIVGETNSGHPPDSNHDEDIIPSFAYDFDNDGIADANSPYPGRNFDAVGQDIWNSGACDGDGVLNPTTGTLIVNKTLVNDNGGTVINKENFSFKVNGGANVSFEHDGSNSLTLAAGTYSIVENAAAGYTTTYSNCSGLVLAAGGTQTCTITNNDNPPIVNNGNITVTKVVVGGNKVVSDFPLFVGATSVTSGTSASFAPGAYVISETNSANYTAVYTGDCADQTHTITLASDQNKTCTITNTYVAPDPTTGSILVTKTAVNNNGTFNFTGSTGISPFSMTTIGGTDTEIISGLTPGSFTITEGTLPTNWVQTSSTCTNVAVAANQQATCEIVNTYTRQTDPTYSLSGKVYNDNNSQNGTYDSESESGLAAWTVFIDGNDNNTLDVGELNTESDANGDYSFTGLSANCYTVREVLQSNWTQTEPTEPQDFEYQVSVGGSTLCNPPSLISSITNLFVKTAQAATIVTLNTTGLNFGNVAQGGGNNGGGGSSGGGSRSGSRPTPPGQVLGEVTTIPSIPPQPQVLGAVTKLPVTGSPLPSVWALAALVGMIILPASIAMKMKQD